MSELSNTNERKTAIVTGGSSGLGPAIAKALLDRGYNVVLSARNEEKLVAQAKAMGEPEHVAVVVGDVSVAADRAALVARTVERFGRVDVLVNNAGIFSPKPFLEVTEDELDAYVATNLKGTFFLSQAAIPHMQKVGGGSIINVGTSLVQHALGGFPAAAPVATKGAIHALTVSLAAEFGKDNIRVNTIAPGIIRSPIHTRNGIEDQDSMAGLALVGRIGETKHIATAAAELATNDFISGVVLNVDGGWVTGHNVG